MLSAVKFNVASDSLEHVCSQGGLLLVIGLFSSRLGSGEDITRLNLLRMLHVIDNNFEDFLFLVLYALLHTLDARCEALDLYLQVHYVAGPALF